MQLVSMPKRPFSKFSATGTDLRAAFEHFVSPEPNSGCWLWTGPYFKHRAGYGCFTMRPAGIIQARAHRLAWRIYCAEVPKGRHILHKCDNPACVNPDHLFVGDQSSNMSDKVSKGRQTHGETHGMSKLSEADAIAIIKDRRLQREIANDYGVSVVTICDIKRGKSWKHLNDYRRAA